MGATHTQSVSCAWEHMQTPVWPELAFYNCTVAGEKNYPWSTRQENTYDVGLPDDTGDEAYLEALSTWLSRLWDDHNPQLVFFQAGVDALKHDSFGRCARSACLSTQ